MPASPGFPHGKSIKNPITYEALKRSGMSKTKAARISNGVLKRGVAKGVHCRGGRCRSR
jgi:citrate lyase alpha subunit